MISEAMAWLKTLMASVEEFIVHAPIWSLVVAFIAGGGFVQLWRVFLDRRKQRVERSRQDLEDLYGPLELHFQQSRSLYNFLQTHRGPLQQQLNRFDKNVEPLIREAIVKFVAGSMRGVMGGLTEDEKRELDRSYEELNRIELLLRPLVFAKAKELRTIVQRA